MTSTPPSPRPEGALAGWRGWSVRSAFAPRPFSRGAIAGVAAVLALGVLEVIAGEEVLVAALLVLPPLVVALTGRWGDTLLVAALALALVLASLLVEDAMQLAISIVLVLAGGIVAVAVAVARTGSVVALERFRLLVGVADVADRADGPDELVEGVLDLLVPVLGDVSAVDVILGGERLRIGARVAPGIDPEVHGAMVRRRELRGEERSSEASMADDVARLVRPDGALLAAAARSPHDAELLRGLRIRTALIVPLRARGRVIGAINAAYGPSGRRHAEGDLRFAEVLAGRVALALDNAGLTSELTRRRGAVRRGRPHARRGGDDERRRGPDRLRQPGGGRAARRASAEELITAAPGDVMDRFAVYDEHGRPLRLARPAERPALAGEPRRRAAARAQRRAGDRRGALAAAQVLGAARRRRRRPADRQRHRGRHGGQARRARASGCSPTPARRSPPPWTTSGSSGRSRTCSSRRWPTGRRRPPRRAPAWCSPSQIADTEPGGPRWCGGSGSATP